MLGIKTLIKEPAAHEGSPAGSSDGTRAGRFREASDGIASVEFALLSTVLLLLLAGSFDVSYMIGTKRDADRMSMLLARVLVTCEDAGCAGTMNAINDRRKNILVRYPTAEIGTATVQRTNGAIKVCAGTMTYLESDIRTSALNIMKDNDVGAAAYIKTTYQPILPNFIVGYIAQTGEIYRNYTIDVRGNGGVCTN